MTKPDFSNIFDAVQMDEDAKKVFLSMPREEQLLAILGMQAWIRSELTSVKKAEIELRQDFHEFKKESVAYRTRRERKEKNVFGDLEGDDEVSTTAKIAREVAKAFSQRFDFWVWFRDKVLPGLISLITIGILYLVFGGRIP